MKEHLQKYKPFSRQTDIDNIAYGTPCKLEWVGIGEGMNGNKQVYSGWGATIKK